MRLWKLRPGQITWSKGEFQVLGTACAEARSRGEAVHLRNRRGQCLPGTQSWERREGPSPVKGLAASWATGSRGPVRTNLYTSGWGGGRQAAIRCVCFKDSSQHLSLDWGDSS